MLIIDGLDKELVHAYNNAESKWIVFNAPAIRYFESFTLKKYKLKKGFDISHVTFMPSCDFVLEQNKNKKKSLVITFCTCGEYSLSISGDEKFKIFPGVMTLEIFQNFPTSEYFKSGSKVKLLQLSVEYEVLCEYVSCSWIREFDNRRAGECRNQPGFVCAKLSPLNEKHIQGIYESSELTETNKLELTIHALKILALNLNYLQNPARKERARRASEIEKLESAYEIIKSNYCKALVVADLAKKVGLSEMRFTTAFKECYGASPKKILTTLKMEKAWELLSGGESVSKTAVMVGYSHASNFSVAFSRYFNRSPKSILGKRCYVNPGRLLAI